MAPLSTRDVIERFRRAGGDLRIEADGRLTVKAPRTISTEDFWKFFEAHRNALKEELEREPRSGGAESRMASEAAASSPPPPLYVATNLDCWPTDEPHLYASDVRVDGVWYRRLDLPYFAWLHAQFERVPQEYEAAGAGRFSAEDWADTEQAYRLVRAWAYNLFEVGEIEAAIASRRDAYYEPPGPWTVTASLLPGDLPDVPRGSATQAGRGGEHHLFPVDGNWPHAAEVTQVAVAQVDAISDQALALGWTRAALHQNRGRLRFPLGDDYGLVCHICDGDEIGEVTREAIVLRRAGGSVLRFYNPAVDQPWRRKTEPNSARHG